MKYIDQMQSSKVIYLLPVTDKVAVSDDVPTALVAWQRYVPESLLEVARTVSVPSVEVGLNVYLEEEEEIVIWDCELEIKIQDIVADGLAETEHGIETSWPVVEEYMLLGIFTDGRPVKDKIKMIIISYE